MVDSGSAIERCSNPREITGVDPTGLVPRSARRSAADCSRLGSARAVTERGVGLAGWPGIGAARLMNPVVAIPKLVPSGSPASVG